MRPSWKLALCAVLLACGCSLNGQGEHDVSLVVNVCPAEAENEARRELGLAGGAAVRLDELLARASNSGFTVEETTLRLRNTQCIRRPDDQSMTIYVIHAGFDASRSYTRHFVVIPDENRIVSDIEVQRAYLAQ